MRNNFEFEHEDGHLSDDEIISLLYANPSHEVEQHLRSCSTCRTEFDTYRRTIEALQHWPTPARAADYEARVWDRVSASMPQKRGTFWARIPLPALGMAAAVAAIALVSFFIQQMRSKQPIKAIARMPSEASHRILDVAVKDHFERTSRVLAKLEISTPVESAHSVDISGEQNTVDDLLAENRLYRQTAEQDGDHRTADLLDNVEQFLVELDHSPPKLSNGQLKNLQQRLSDTNVLSKLKVFTSSKPDSSPSESPVTQL